MDYLIVIEKTGTGYSAYAPDLPGCIATGNDLDSVRTKMREAVEFHIEGLRLEGFAIPEPSSRAVFFELEKEGTVTGERRVETLYGIGRKMGRGWVFTDADLLTLSRSP